MNAGVGADNAAKSGENAGVRCVGGWFSNVQKTNAQYISNVKAQYITPGWSVSIFLSLRLECEHLPIFAVGV